MNTEILDFVERDSLVFTWFCIGWRVILRVCSECANVDFARGYRSMGINLFVSGVGVSCVRQQQPRDLGISDFEAE